MLMSHRQIDVEGSGNNSFETMLRIFICITLSGLRNLQIFKDLTIFKTAYDSY